MSDKYAPGTPVKVTIRDQEVLAYAFYGNAEPRLRWYIPNPPWPIKTHDPLEDFDTWFLGTQGTNPRRLAIIDPESEAQVERLMTYYVGTPLTDAEVPDMQRALQAYAAPPRAKRPTEIGAVVVDCGERFVHVGGGLFARCYPNHSPEPFAWEDFTADAEVVSEGATSR